MPSTRATSRAKSSAAGCCSGTGRPCAVDLAQSHPGRTIVFVHHAAVSPLQATTTTVATETVLASPKIALECSRFCGHRVQLTTL